MKATHKNKKVEIKEKAKIEKERVAEEINKAIEAIGILKGFQVFPHLPLLLELRKQNFLYPMNIY